ncbi:hypothetical protein EMPS_02270 [Entomortierella parvispora]|uniref:SH3 domain-containing protein n=1 Tax=Entomortierella parvispora TaxID=205924 RepID=A0A9P3H4E3_9FUNG|nr:hypothetical protein EMPS_02270 [Entomortierella parvispora]
MGLISLSVFILASVATEALVFSANAAADTASPRGPVSLAALSSGSGEMLSPSSPSKPMVAPPVDFRTLGPMAILGDFDGLTPIITQGQQNSFEGKTFSILELSRVPKTLSSTTPSSQEEDILSVPVLLASFLVDDNAGSTENWIKATCVLQKAPHQIYIGGYFKQILSATSASSNNTNNNNSTDYLTSVNSATIGLNYIGMYDTILKRFLSLDNGLDGPVQNLLCDSTSNQVYVVGQFRAPLQENEVLSSASNSGNSGNDHGSNSNSSQYQTIGAFGGGIAIWQKGAPEALGASSTLTKATGSWAAVPFKGVNGIVTSVARAQDGTLYFGGLFDTTTDGESYSAPDTQPVNLDSIIVSTENGVNTKQDRDIICQSSTASRGNWLMRENVPGFWRVQFPLYITPTLFRLWNVDDELTPESENRGTKTFSIMAQPTNQLLNLSYVDPATHIVHYCTVCPLLPLTQATSGISSGGEGTGYQDFLVVTPVLLHAAQINIISWYGRGGGLGGIEVFQSEIFVRAVNSLNTASGCASTATAATVAMAMASGSNKKDNKDMTTYSSFLGADWITMNMTDGWQTVLAASILATDQTTRKQAYVDLVPYLQESGYYDVYLYTPACSSYSKNTGNTTVSNSCADRGFVDVSMYFGSPENVITTTISQENTVDKYDKIYSGMIVHSSADFRPHVVVGPSITKTGTNGGGSLQSVIVDSVQFVKQATLNNTNSLIFYRPGVDNDNTSGSVSSSTGGVTISKAQGLDGSTWGNLPTQLPSGALVNSLITYSGPTGSSSSFSQMLYIGGEFQGASYSNVVAWDGSKFVPLGPHASDSGLDGAVTSMVLDESTLYITGAFKQVLGANASPSLSSLEGLASYSISTQTWSAFGNASSTFQPYSQFYAIQRSTGPEGQPQLILTGNFSFVLDNHAESIAVWDLTTQNWIRNATPSSTSSPPSGGMAGGFPFGYVRGNISYFNRVMGSNSNGTLSNASPVVLVAGQIDSLDTYQVLPPTGVAWLTSSGRLKTTNLSPSIAITPKGHASLPVSGPKAAMLGPTPSQTLEKSNAGIVYYDMLHQEWVTIVAGSYKNGSVGAGSYATPITVDRSQPPSPIFKEITLVGPEDPSATISGEILALGINKDDSNGRIATRADGGELLLLGGRFKGSNSRLQGLAVYDMFDHQVVSPSLVPMLKGAVGRGEPVIHVIKNRPVGSGKGELVLAGDFSGVGTDVVCELICLWDPAAARQALDKKKSIESSFKSVYGDSGSKKKMGLLKGVVHDIAFEDDKNMFIAGDLIVDGVACGVASYNFDQSKWTTFGSIFQNNATDGNSHPPGPDTLSGPVTAIAHDTTFHRFFVAGRSSIDGSAYFKKWNGNRFIRISPEFLPTSDVHRLEILPANKHAPLRSAQVVTTSVIKRRSSAAVIASSGESPYDNYFDEIDNELSTETSSPSNPNADSNNLNSNAPGAGRVASISSSGIDPFDTTRILEQGFILLVSGRIVLGNPASSSLFMNLNNGHQESGLAFFDGLNWYPFIQSSRNATSSTGQPLVGPGTLVSTHIDPVTLPSPAAAAAHHKRQLPGSTAGSAPASSTPLLPVSLLSLPSRVRDQGVFRALAIAHLPRIIARDYLAFPYVVLISVAISLGLILSIVLFGFLYVWLKRRFGQDKYSASRPRLGSSFMEDGYDGYLQRAGRGGPMDYGSQTSLGHSQGAAMVAGAYSSGGTTEESEKKRKGSLGSLLTFGRPSKSKFENPDSSSALMDSLGITSALESARRYRSQTGMAQHNDNSLEGSPVGLRGGTLGRRRNNHSSTSLGGGTNAQGTGSMVFRPNSTIEQATGALVTEFVKNHQQQLAGGSGSNGNGSGSGNSSTKQLNRSRESIDGLQQLQDPDAPPSPDRRSKKSRHSMPQSSQDRDSTNSDLLLNPMHQGRIASLLAAANAQAPSTPISNAPTSPATTMTTPGGVVGVGAILGTSLFAPTASTAHEGSQSNSSESAVATTGGRNSGAGMIYYAKYPFRAREIGELGFKTGERILVVDMSDDIWWMGVIQDASGQQMHGVFPSNYVGPTP